MNYEHNLILNTDSYKASHWVQYPDGTQRVFSYIESRGGKYDKTLFFGLQIFLKEYLSVKITKEMVEFAEVFFREHGEPFNKPGWNRLLEKHNGILPLKICAVPEGTVLPVKNVLVTVENTDEEFFWLTSYIETALLRAVWYPTTVATQSWKIKQLIKKYLEKNGDVSGLPFKLHDFGARGVSSLESASIGGASHLVNFMGSDTVSGVLALMKYYNAPVSGYSIPAAEHSTTTILGPEGEEKQFRRILEKLAKPGGLVAVVSDGYNIYNAISEIWGKKLRQKVIDSGATIVIRPDSGDPATVVLECLRRLYVAFGAEVNSKGYKVLNHVRVIQGDGINEESIEEILRTADEAGYSSDNIAFGMGGALLQGINRDTQKFAMKTSAAKINDEWRDVFKDPITDQGKTSKKGRITLVKENGEFKTVRDSGQKSELVLVWENGILIKDYTLDEIRKNSEM